MYDYLRPDSLECLELEERQIDNLHVMRVSRRVGSMPVLYIVMLVVSIEDVPAASCRRLTANNSDASAAAHFHISSSSKTFLLGFVLLAYDTSDLY